MDSPLQSKANSEDEALDTTLRPRRWEEYIGQESVKRNLRVLLDAAIQRNETPEHLLFHGAAGLGKTTLSNLVAEEIGTELRIIAAPSLEQAGDLAAILTNLQEGDVLFVDECHRLHKTVEEYLYPAMEDFQLNLILGKGPMARTSEVPLPRFTLIGATTRLALLSSPLRSRFGATFQLTAYSPEEIAAILRRSAQLLELEAHDDAIHELAARSRATPRVANRLLKRARDYAQIEGGGILTKDIAKHALTELQIDEQGLEPADRYILHTIVEKFDGGPVGLQALAAASSQEEDTILEVYEPYLMQLGFVERTPRGRVATRHAYEHLGYTPQQQQQNALWQ